MASYPQGDTLVGPVVHQLALVAAQVAGVGRVYELPPDRAPEDNSVLVPLREWKVLASTNGKLKVALSFELLHLFRRTPLPDAVGRAQAALPAWWQALAAWPNQSLAGLAISVDLSDGKVYETTWADIPYIALAHTVTVLTEFNIPTA